MSTTEESPRRVELTRKWTPHPGQEPLLESDARFKIVACGRRFGKTEFAAHDLFEKAAQAPESLMWWVAPTYDIADTGFDLLTEIIPEGFIEDIKRSKPREITLANGSTIGFRTTDREDGLVSVGLDHLVIDEAAMVPERAWKKELRPTLSDTLGTMVAISTPKGRNWFYEYYQRGQDPDQESVASWSASTYDNPHVPDQEVDDAEKELPDRLFRQEYLAEFVDDSGGVFTRVRERIVADYDYEAAEGEQPYSIGVDFARHQDWTVITVLDGTGQLVGFERLRDVSWPQIQAAVERMHRQYGGWAYVDASRDNKIVADLEASGIDVEPVKFTSQTKRDLVENLATQIEQEGLTIPEIPELINELQIFEYETTPAGNVRYHAPEGFHDDCVDSLALAARGYSEATRREPESYSFSF